MTQPTRQLFGTDGIRARAGVYPLDPETVLRLGCAAADVLIPNQQGTIDEPTLSDRDWPSVVIGKDTRQSCDMLEAAISAGLNFRGIDVRLAGVIPTPAVAFLTRQLQASFGIVISASHNPFHDNGIKFFGPDGYKLDDAVESAIESRLLSGEDFSVPESIGRTAPISKAANRYVHFVCDSVEDPAMFEGLKIALDCANGASFETSEAVLQHLGAEVIPFHNRPSGLNINADCGCTHPSAIEELVRETGADVGIAHDGDADRVLLADETGSVLDGDELMAIAGIDMIEQGVLHENTVVATLMSNAGLDEALSNAGGRIVRAGVGDRYVIEKMREGDFNFGGEQSGHLIFRDQNTTGDGIMAAVQILRIMKRRQQPLSELRKLMHKFPQAQRNIRVVEKPPVESLEVVQGLIAETEQELGKAGRTLLRYSGTEPLLRLLIEGRDSKYIESRADQIAAAIEEQIGG
ncbi:MAG: phosphoglucosamine mutase [Verrucomicrobiales bacterium]|nr:phosphoglucosamine mutase [Verrucomicrobiales bacterium]